MAKDITVKNSPILRTEDYDKFKWMEGNRDVDDHHVDELKKLMVDNGNLTQDMPVLVNPDMEIIDGQHRLSALMQLQWPVFYQIRENMGLEQVRAINVGHRNWTWYDFASSFAKLGNEHYGRFVKLADEFPSYGYGVIARYAGLRDIRNPFGANSGKFRKGEAVFPVEAYENARIRLNMWEEVAEKIPQATTVFAQAYYLILQNPLYDHTRMLDKAAKYATRVMGERWVQPTQNEAIRALEAIYNFHAREEVRLA